ncbi:hypothetical protein PMIN06_011247 [Paraphaeosphaeria minitans]
MDPRSDNNWRPLLPRVGMRSPSPTINESRRPRSKLACEPCRKKKIKCSGVRPVCARCSELDINCVYAVDSGDESRRMTLKKKFDRVEDERDQLQDLFDLLCTSLAAEAEELFRRLRTSRDPLAVLQMVRQAHLLLSEPDPTSPTVSIPEVEKLDKDALRRSAFKLRAHPWTTAAGDGIVSSLTSSFFAWDGSYLVFPTRSDEYGNVKQVETPVVMTSLG